MKYTSKLKALFVLVLLAVTTLQAQPKKQKIDGVAAVVGDYVVLDSDIDLMMIELRANGISSADVTRCELLGKLLEDRLYAHHAVQDSLVVTDEEVRSYMDEQLSVMVEQIGSMDKVVKYYNKKNVDDFKNYFFDIIKMNKLVQAMNRKIVDDIEITPEEVRNFFNKIPKDEIPTIGSEVEIAQIVIKPIVSEEEKQKVIKKLREIKQDVLENGSSFTTKAVLYTEDRASAPNGGYYKINKKTQFVKEFKDVAFTLEEGEISEPFETIYGFHIIKVEKILGQEIELRHILMSPKVSDESLAEAKTRIENIRAKILNKELTFSEAAKSFSEDKETKNNGGIILNPKTLEPKFELTKMDPSLYNEISELQTNEISRVILDEIPGEGKFFKIITVNEKTQEHPADFSKDFLKIKEIALKDKQITAIGKWTKEKIAQTYIKINGEYRDCVFASDWLKKEIK
ncbi:peptidylprolyl isomerase [Flavobacterium ponti]|uniref:Peptidylprolyl isomerase n=1 Tax=Flavobacterium ponti TaxID=665133 RepID=A0ABV9P9I9_9FLAO